MWSAEASEQQKFKNSQNCKVRGVGDLAESIGKQENSMSSLEKYLILRGWDDNFGDVVAGIYEKSFLEKARDMISFGEPSELENQDMIASTKSKVLWKEGYAPTN